MGNLLKALDLEPKAPAVFAKAVDDFIDAKDKQLRKLNKDTMPGFADVFEEMSHEGELKKHYRL